MSLKKLNIGVVGATGVVGETFLLTLEDRGFPVGELRLFASENSQGLSKNFAGQAVAVQTLKEGCFQGLDLVFFSSGDDISREWAPKAVSAGAFAVDNSAAFRMNSEVALVVPEVNADLLPRPGHPAIIANPNCSTIQLAVALAPLQKKFGLKAVRVATYQAVSGAGKAGLEELLDHTTLALEGEEPPASKVFSKSVAFDCVPQIGSFNDDGYCTEEIKIMKETGKILRQESLPVSAFTVRVPALNSHAEVAWVTLNKSDLSANDICECLANAEGIELLTKASSTEAKQSATQVSMSRIGYPTQALASGQDPVYVGRVHRDIHDPSTFLLWIVSDNLRKGAALNGCQIAERIFDITPRP
jgi:aspartate-semialdehyde dehydrogenase